MSEWRTWPCGLGLCSSHANSLLSVSAPFTPFPWWARPSVGPPDSFPGLTCCVLNPAVYPDGRVCISILHAPGDDPMGYESSAERWSPVQSVEKILLSVVSMLAGNVPRPPGRAAAGRQHSGCVSVLLWFFIIHFWSWFIYIRCLLLSR